MPLFYFVSPFIDFIDTVFIFVIRFVIRCPLYCSPTTSLYVRLEGGRLSPHPARPWQICTSALKNARLAGAVRITLPGRLQKRAANAPNVVR
jgi:hypothetical protein